MHSMHSPWSVTATSPPIAAMRQFDSQRPQRVHPASVIRRRKSPNRPMSASIPPRGQRFLHQNRRWYRSATRMPRKRIPTIAEVRKTGCSKARKWDLRNP